jgi:hypothetical protein
MAPIQKQAPDRQDEALAAASKVFSLWDSRYQAIMPAGAGGIDTLSLPDFFSGTSHHFKLFNVPGDYEM